MAIRPLLEADCAAAAEAFVTAIEDLHANQGRPRQESDELANTFARVTRRVAYMQATDPGGCFVAEENGAIVGMAQAFRRDGWWVLSLLGVRTDVQDGGVGRALFGAALDYGGPDLRGSIQASTDPRAIGLYQSAGFALHPCVGAYGAIRWRPESSADVIVAGPGHLDQVAAIDLVVRGSTRLADVEFLINEGADLLLWPERAYGVATDDRIVMGAGLDEASLRAVLETAIARAGPTFEIGWLNAHQQWSIDTARRAGLELRPQGPMMLKGTTDPFTPYITSGGMG